jgi:glycerol kinase
VDGGASANNFILQFQADIIQTSVVRPECIETTALGAAFLAGLATGFWRDLDEIRNTVKISAVFVPSISQGAAGEKLVGWHKAVGRSLGWARPDAE